MRVGKFDGSRILDQALVSVSKILLMADGGSS
jgi:hypothetical protein